MLRFTEGGVGGDPSVVHAGPLLHSPRHFVTRSSFDKSNSSCKSSDDDTHSYNTRSSFARLTQTLDEDRSPETEREKLFSESITG